MTAENGETGQTVDTDFDEDVLGDEQDETHPLASAVGMVRDLGIAMPPIPSFYEDELLELRPGSLYATDGALAVLNDRGRLETRLESREWPNAGVAFGSSFSRGVGHWFYVLASAKQLLLLSFRLWFRSESEANDSRDRISAAHHLLEIYLDDPTRFHKAVDAYPVEGYARRDVLLITNEMGFTQEYKGLWTAENGLGQLRSVKSAFFDDEDDKEEQPETLFFRL